MSARGGASHIVHIGVCVCTYRRAHGLRRLLKELGRQETEGRFTYSVVVVDNDQEESARATVAEFAVTSGVPAIYRVERRRGIPMARNKAVESATGDYLAFIDDDEVPVSRWLLKLLTACERYGVDGVLGPVKRKFEVTPPEWVIRGGFYDRPVRPTGLAVRWSEARTGNVLIKHSVFRAGEPAFREEFRTGEDLDFFRRKMAAGYKFVWCAEGEVFEIVPPARWKRSVMLKRALLRGAINRIQPTFGVVSLGKSLLAVLIYTAALPFAALVGQHRFMPLLVRLCDHLGKLLAFGGINLIRKPYVTE